MKKDVSNNMNQSTIEKELMYKQIVEYSVETIVIHADHKILYVNQTGAQNLKGTKEEIIGSCLLDRYREASKPRIKERIHKSMTENVPGELMEEKIFRLDGKQVDVELYCHPVVFGNQRAIQTTLRDITKRKEEEKQHKREIYEVSTPLVPVLDGISVLPIVGSIDIDRANYLLESIPSKIKKEEVRCLVIDFSGIYNFCEVVSDFLMKITAIMRLLGIDMIITGIRPELAQIAVENGVDLSSTKTMATVKEAVKYHLDN
ncbi:PAS domain S-box protein [Bacillus sp. CECT 9360]|uniref:PAS domain S-box protein n=1 Tax=Bacillus sp. CECT 9360 TaxID=2845821 RepID=UPI001E61C0C4|nr:PAS domain S-box protein [Bacillus sp. CECT 9360]CAH0345876.1 Blue-light photoreceptor [Bacillus sp. CECT 9360]